MSARALLILICMIILSEFTAYLLSQGPSQTETEFEKQTTGLFDIVIRVVVQDSLLHYDLEEDIKKWLLFSRSYFKEEADITIWFLPVQSFSINKEYFGEWDHHKTLSIVRELSTQYKLEAESLIVFIEDSSSGNGKTVTDSGVTLIAIKPGNDRNRFITRKWLVVHEISHLFGILDLREPNNILDEDVILNATKKSEPHLFFDQDSLEVMKTAKNYMVQRGISAFNFIQSDLETGERMIPFKMRMESKLRQPLGLYFSIGSFYLTNHNPMKGLDYLDQALEMINEKPEEGFQHVPVNQAGGKGKLYLPLVSVGQATRSSPPLIH